jgi:hypothetical protein
MSAKVGGLCSGKISDVELTVYNGVDVVVCCVRHGGWGRGWRPQNMSEFK